MTNNDALITAAQDLINACNLLCQDDLTAEQFMRRLAFASVAIEKAEMAIATATETNR